MTITLTVLGALRPDVILGMNHGRPETLHIDVFSILCVRIVAIVMGDGAGVKIGRLVYFLCVVLQITMFPVLPLAEEGKADHKADPTFVSPLQVC